MLACSFAHDNSVQRKGVKFGSKLKVRLTVKQTRNWLIGDMYPLLSDGNGGCREAWKAQSTGAGRASEDPIVCRGEQTQWEGRALW